MLRHDQLSNQQTLRNAGQTQSKNGPTMPYSTITAQTATPRNCRA